ncbi:MAG: GNAT family N-acetyltransferase [Chloroflexi bacterium]|nr:GNAT family N-acetyltransferase [Chloroflexota bacterium]
MIDNIPQGRLLGALPIDPILHATAWIGCQQRPDAPAQVWYNARGDFEGALIDCEWATFHLVATTRDALLALLERLPTCSPLGWRISFPEWATRDVAEKFPKSQISYEVLHLCRSGDYKAPASRNEQIVRLTPHWAERYLFDLELVKAISGLALDGPGPVCAAIEDEQAVSIADGTTMSEYAAIVQGVYTVPDYRRRGLARAVVARVTECALALGRVVLYAADYTNYPSLGLCRALGYRPIAVSGLAEFEA